MHMYRLWQNLCTHLLLIVQSLNRQQETVGMWEVAPTKEEHGNGILFQICVYA